LELLVLQLQGNTELSINSHSATKTRSALAEAQITDSIVNGQWI
jgi:hypothetical protein